MTNFIAAGENEVWTLGHSNRSVTALLELLRAHGIQTLADVRAFPSSRLHPQFNRPRLQAELSRWKMDYCWLGRELGGYRKSAQERSPHLGLSNPGFRAYAHHMGSELFRHGIDRLLALRGRTACLCAERKWSECHRSYISDYLLAVLGVAVFHVVDEATPTPHQLNPLARVTDGRLVYDRGQTASLFQQP